MSRVRGRSAASRHLFEALAAVRTNNVVAGHLAAAMIASQDKTHTTGKTTRGIGRNNVLALRAQAGAAGVTFTAAHRQTSAALRAGKGGDWRSRMSAAGTGAVLWR